MIGCVYRVLTRRGTAKHFDDQLKIYGRIFFEDLRKRPKFWVFLVFVCLCLISNYYLGVSCVCVCLISNYFLGS